MCEPVAAVIPQVELDRVERAAHGRLQRVAERRGRLHRDASRTRLDPRKTGTIDLDDSKAGVESHRRRIRPGRPGADDDEIEIARTWKIGNSCRNPTEA